MIRPKKVLDAVRYLLETSAGFRAENIELSEEWHIKLQEEVSVDGKFNDLFHISGTEEELPPVSPIKMTQITETGQYEIQQKEVEDEEADSDEEWIEMVEKESECGVDETAIVSQSMVADQNLMKNISDPQFLQQLELDVAPGEGNRPLSLYMDNTVLTLAFPTVFGGRDVVLPRRVYFSEYAKWILMHVDSNPRLCIDLVFYMMKRLQIESAVNNINIAFKKLKGNKMSVSKMLTGTMIKDSVFKVHRYEFYFIILFILR